MADVRELSGPIVHPEFLDGWSRVDAVENPAVKALYDGDPALLWEGDNRLCLYRNGMENCYVLVRLEADEEYRKVIRSPAGEIIGVDSVNRLIRKLQSVDSRRGADLMALTMGVNDAVAAAKEAQFSEAVHEEYAPRLVYWATHSHLPGIDVAPKLR